MTIQNNIYVRNIVNQRSIMKYVFMLNDDITAWMEETMYDFDINNRSKVYHIRAWCSTENINVKIH
jgi:hypothetical protein